MTTPWGQKCAQKVAQPPTVKGAQLVSMGRKKTNSTFLTSHRP